MKSRYNYMNRSSHKDIDGDYFPDPSSINYNNIEASNITSIEMTEVTCEKPWLLLPLVFGNYEYDDVLLTLNRIPHKNMLKPGDILYAPTVEDIEKGLAGNES